MDDVPSLTPSRGGPFCTEPNWSGATSMASLGPCCTQDRQADRDMAASPAGLAGCQAPALATAFLPVQMIQRPAGIQCYCTHANSYTHSYPATLCELQWMTRAPAP